MFIQQLAINDTKMKWHSIVSGNIIDFPVILDPVVYINLGWAMTGQR